MANYSIKDLEKLTGIKAHTIRIWEKRYKAIIPQRTETNIRYYNDDDLKKILNISILNRHGVKISHIVQKSNEELNKAVENLTFNENHFGGLIESLVVSMIEIDENKFDKSFTNAVIKFGFEETIIKIIYPFLEKVGLLWQIGTINPAQEHFVSNLIRQKLIVAIDGQAKTLIPNYKTFILFLPEGELHEFGLLLYYFILRKHGHKVIYLGQTVPYQDIKIIAGLESNPVFITSFVMQTQISEINNYLIKISKDFPKSTVYITGEIIKQTSNQLPKNIVKINSAYHFKEIELGSTRE